MLGNHALSVGGDLVGEDGGDGGLEPEAHRVVQVYVHHHVTLVRRLLKVDKFSEVDSEVKSTISWRCWSLTMWLLK